MTLTTDKSTEGGITKRKFNSIQHFPVYTGSETFVGKLFNITCGGQLPVNQGGIRELTRRVEKLEERFAVKSSPKLCLS